MWEHIWMTMPTLMVNYCDYQSLSRHDNGTFGDDSSVGHVWCSLRGKTHRKKCDCLFPESIAKWGPGQLDSQNGRY